MLFSMKHHMKKLNTLDNFLEIDDQLPMVYYRYRYFVLLGLYQYDKAIPEYEKALEIYKNGVQNLMGIELYSTWNAYHKTGQYRKEKRLYKKAEDDFPDDIHITV